jgi:hypothetical protein
VKDGLGVENDKALLLLLRLGDHARRLSLSDEWCASLSSNLALSAREAAVQAFHGLPDHGGTAVLTHIGCGTLAPVVQYGCPLLSGRLENNGEWVCQFSHGGVVRVVAIPSAGRRRMMSAPLALPIAALPQVWADSTLLAMPAVLDRCLNWGLSLSINRQRKRPEWTLSQRSASAWASAVWDGASGEPLP